MRILALFLLFFSGFILSFSAEATLVHHYEFNGLAALSDQVGTADLSQQGTAGTLEINPEGFIRFSGTSVSQGAVHLATTFSQPYNNFIVNIWFRIPTIDQVNNGSIFAGNSSSSTTGFETLIRNDFGVYVQGGQDLELLPSANLSTNEWHLLTMMHDPASATNVGQAWLDDQYYEFGNDSFGDLSDFKLGVNRQGNKSFQGDIAEIRVYNEESWDSTRQATAFADGPSLVDQGVPEPAVITFIILFGSGGLVIRRIFR